MEWLWRKIDLMYECRKSQNLVRRPDGFAAYNTLRFEDSVGQSKLELTLRKDEPVTTPDHISEWIWLVYFQLFTFLLMFSLALLLSGHLFFSISRNFYAPSFSVHKEKDSNNFFCTKYKIQNIQPKGIHQNSNLPAFVLHGNLIFPRLPLATAAPGLHQGENLLNSPKMTCIPLSCTCNSLHKKLTSKTTTKCILVLQAPLRPGLSELPDPAVAATFL